MATSNMPIFSSASSVLSVLKELLSSSEHTDSAYDLSPFTEAGYRRSITGLLLLTKLHRRRGPAPELSSDEESFSSKISETLALRLMLLSSSEGGGMAAQYCAAGLEEMIVVLLLLQHHCSYLRERGGSVQYQLTSVGAQELFLLNDPEADFPNDPLCNCL